MSLLDLDELALRCRDQSARRLLEEAVACYRIGAYKACVVSTWIAVSYDIVRKLRELRAIGDGRADQLIERLETYQAQLEARNQQATGALLNFESSLLEESLKLELIDHNSYLDLQRLRHDRHRCAHPTFERYELPYVVSAEQARLHLRNAVEHVLSQPPVHGRAALDQIAAQIASGMFPTFRRDIETALKASPLARASDALVRGFADKILYELLLEPPPWDEVQAANVLAAAMNLHPKRLEERLTDQAKKLCREGPEHALHRVAYVSLILPEICNTLGPAETARITSLIEKGELAKITTALRAARRIRKFHIAVWRRMRNLPLEDCIALASYPDLHSELISCAVRHYSTVKNWHDANRVAINLMIPMASSVTKDHLESVAKAISSREADILGSTQFPAFLSRVAAAGKVSVADMMSVLQSHGLNSEAEKLNPSTASLDDDVPF